MSPDRRAQITAAHPGGFTLLEVMVALAIGALALAAISLSNAKAVQNSVKVYRMTSASMLMRGIVLDIEEEYQLDGFPENDLTTRDCDVARPFDKTFDCEYDLERMQFEAGELESLFAGALSGVMGGMDMAGLMGGGSGSVGRVGGARGEAEDEAGSQSGEPPGARERGVKRREVRAVAP